MKIDIYVTVAARKFKLKKFILVLISISIQLYLYQHSPLIIYNQELFINKTFIL